MMRKAGFEVIDVYMILGERRAIAAPRSAGSIFASESQTRLRCADQIAWPAKRRSASVFFLISTESLESGISRFLPFQVIRGIRHVPAPAALAVDVWLVVPAVTGCASGPFSARKEKLPDGKEEQMGHCRPRGAGQSTRRKEDPLDRLLWSEKARESTVTSDTDEPQRRVDLAPHQSAVAFAGRFLSGLVPPASLLRPPPDGRIPSITSIANGFRR